MKTFKTNTAVRKSFGPFVDPTDGKTAETALDVTALVCEIYQDKDEGSAVVRTAFSPTASAGDNDMVHIADDVGGYYDLELTAANLNWLGTGKISFYDVDGFLICWQDIEVVHANYFNLKFSTTLGAPAGASLQADIAAVKAETALIVADTDELQTDDYPTSIAAIKAETALIVADTNELQADDYPTSIAAIKAETALIVEDTAVIGALGAGLTALSTQASVDAIKTETALIVADTNELQTDDYVTSIAAVKSDTAAILIDTAEIGAAGVGLTAIWDTASAITLGFGTLIERAYQMVSNKMTVVEATGVVALRNIGDTGTIATGEVVSNAGTTSRDELSWA